MSLEKTNPLERVRREVEEALTTFYESIGKHHQGVSGRASGDFSPPADVRDGESSIRISMDLAGLCSNDIKIEASDGWLTVSGEKQEHSERKDEGYLLRECSYGAFSRSFLIPQGADVASISAVMNKGRLEIEVPVEKFDNPAPRQIEVQEK